MADSASLAKKLEEVELKMKELDDGLRRVEKMRREMETEKQKMENEKKKEKTSDLCKKIEPLLSLPIMDSELHDEGDVPDTQATVSNNEFDTLLVHLVAQYELLYDKGHKDYKNNVLRESCWLQIGQVLEVPAVDCLKRWAQLRESFGREKKKREAEAKSGSGLSQRRGFYLYENMKFLEGHIGKRRALTNVSLTNNKRLRGLSTSWNLLPPRSQVFSAQTGISLPRTNTAIPLLQMIPLVAQAVPTSTMTAEAFTRTATSLTSMETFDAISPPNSELDFTPLSSSPIPLASTPTSTVTSDTVLEMSTLLHQGVADASIDITTSPSSSLPSPISTSASPTLHRVPTPIISHNQATSSVHHSKASTNTHNLTLPCTPPPSTPTPPPFFRVLTPSSLSNSPASPYSDSSSQFSQSHIDTYETTSDKIPQNACNTRSRLYTDRIPLTKISNRDTHVPLPSNLVETSSCYNMERKKSKKLDPIESAVLSLSGTLANHFANLEGKEKEKNESVRIEQVVKQIQPSDQALGMFIASEISNIPEPQKSKKKARLLEVLFGPID